MPGRDYLFVTKATKSCCQCISLRYWQTVRHLIGTCLEKIIRPSHPLFHLRDVTEEQFCPSENWEEWRPSWVPLFKWNTLPTVIIFKMYRDGICDKLFRNFWQWVQPPLLVCQSVWCMWHVRRAVICYVIQIARSPSSLMFKLCAQDECISPKLLVFINIAGHRNRLT